VRAWGQREDGMPSVELSDGEEIHRRDEHPHPRSAVDRADLEQDLPVHDPLEKGGQQGRAEVALRSAGHERHDRGALESDVEDRKCHDESRDGTGRCDVEESAPRGDGPADADHRSERADEQGDPGDEERNGRRDTVVAAGEIVAHLVGAEDQEQQEGVRRAGLQVRERQRFAP